jgi:hypothetical protein
MFTYSTTIPNALRVRFEGTDTCKAIQANRSELLARHTAGTMGSWRVEHARERDGCLEVWLFLVYDDRSDNQMGLPQEHIHLTVFPDLTESSMHLHFRIAGKDRLIVAERPHGPTSPN